jgi:hypothetical protein
MWWQGFIAAAARIADDFVVDEPPRASLASALHEVSPTRRPILFALRADSQDFA